ncbi:thiamine phosphate synthase [Methanobrevibacter curvatus]|uniref:Thiamine-phosphate synthase n=1 Tax=Methanobrevibacter curvatus TaxID=49547 RepID=A0A166E906_9EURY|nr:thiamine phosphate synthase [Methanobrevibacter curvatus]KZX16405.1 thiamine-phosphate synthase [Methanobrevibacter curvatus]
MNKIDLSLYLITNSDNKTDEEYLKIVEEAINGGVTTVQIREKKKSSKKFYELANKLKEITDKHNIKLIVNDRIDIALAINADGVHIGQNDMEPKIARKLIGDEKILGISASNINESIKAEKDGADYIGTGAIFPSKTKKDAKKASINELKNIVDSVNIPVVAIGGLNENNIHQLKDTKIKGLCFVSAIMNSKNPKKTVQKLLRTFKTF